MNNSPKNNILNIKKNLKYKYGLLENAFSKSDLHEGIKVLKSGFITMGENTRLFEKEFAKKVNANFAVMVNSGSSANLLSVFAAGNILRKNKFKFGDEVLIPVLCWSTSLWPLIQAGLKPIFVDINPETLNVNADVFISKITKKTKVIMLVNVLGACENIKKYRLCLIILNLFLKLVIIDPSRFFSHTSSLEHSIRRLNMYLLNNLAK